MSSLLEIESKLKTIIDGFSGKVGYEIKNLSTNERIIYQNQEIFPTASTIKTFILGALLDEVKKNNVSLTELMTMERDQQVGGTGVLKELTGGSKYAVKDVAMLMMIVSDNTATNMLIDLLGGVEAVNRYIKNLGFNQTELRNRVDFEKIKEDANNLGVATAEEFVQYLTIIEEGKILPPHLTNVFFDIMRRQQMLDQFPRYLPYNPYAKELGVEQTISVANKTGSLGGIRGDIGYLFVPQGKYAFAVFTKNSSDLSFSQENEGAILIGNIGKTIYDSITEGLF